jgi:hypothetical protein
MGGTEYTRNMRGDLKKKTLHVKLFFVNHPINSTVLHVKANIS